MRTPKSGDLVEVRTLPHLPWVTLPVKEVGSDSLIVHRTDLPVRNVVTVGLVHESAGRDHYCWRWPTKARRRR